MSQGLSLSELILDVADQLRVVKDQSDLNNAVMTFKECELELQVQVASEGGLKVKFYVLEAGMTDTRLATHTIKVKFSAYGNTVMAPVWGEPADPAPAHFRETT